MHTLVLEAATVFTAFLLTLLLIAPTGDGKIQIVSVVIGSVIAGAVIGTLVLAVLNVGGRHG